MTSATVPGDVGATRSAANRAPLLHWMIFTGLTVFAAVVLWRHGYLERMAASDRTYISSAIVILYIASCAHCFWRTAVVSREGEAAGSLQRELSDGKLVLDGATAGGRWPQGSVRDHILSLQTKARNQGGGRLDQTLLLRNLADRLRGSNGLGAFAGDSLM